jgi:hypothetical protein
MRNLLSALAAATFLAFGSRAQAYILTEDIPSLTHSIIAQVENYAKYVQSGINQLVQIENQITGLENQVIALERFGDPRYYVNLLGLDRFLATSSQLVSGVGQVISDYRQIADGALALQYTGQGLYQNLAGTVDRYGNEVRYQPNSFRKFAAINDMVESYNGQQRTFNAQMASLQQQLTSAMQNLNAASTQMATEKYSAQVNGIHAQINALTANTTLGGQRAAIQQIANQNDAARVQEAERQTMVQERQTDLQNEAAGFGRLIGGKP